MSLIRNFKNWKSYLKWRLNLGFAFIQNVSQDSEEYNCQKVTQIVLSKYTQWIDKQQVSSYLTRLLEFKFKTEIEMNFYFIFTRRFGQTKVKFWKSHCHRYLWTQKRYRFSHMMYYGTKSDVHTYLISLPGTSKWQDL